ncbi:MAG TPA: Uma2 family endonuclease [Chloroflexota bacterium]|nr:Uma2 family endonuclease [Chloroflexota bacterium]
MSVQRRYTSRDLDLLPHVEGTRYEIINGELHVSSQPSWRHQRAASRICTALTNWSDETGLGEPTAAPGVIFAEDDDVAPDIVWISTASLEVGLDSAGHLTLAPDLIVEVLSPGSTNVRRDRVLKLDLYSRQGVKEYWIVDCRLRTVDVYRRGSSALELVATLADDDALTSPLLPGFSCPLRQVW